MLSPSTVAKEVLLAEPAALDLPRIPRVLGGFEQEGPRPLASLGTPSGRPLLPV